MQRQAGRVEKLKNNMFKNVDDTKIYIENEQSAVEIKQEHYRLLQDTVLTCLRHENIETGCEVNILLTDDASIKEINSEFRKVDAPTDVLSFPMADIIKGEIKDDGGDYDIDEGLLMIGDIVISTETALRQSEMYGHSFEREIAFLTAHGVFHLLGYDHMEKDDEAEMMAKQEAVLDKLGLRRE